MVLSDTFGAWLFAFLLLAVVLGGAAAAASGRAVAHAWRPFARVPVYMLALTGAVGFLHYALFGLPAIPAGDIVDAVTDLATAPGNATARLGAALAYPALLFIVLTGFAFVGHRMTRTGQMARQYGFRLK
jgi:hypothetical protein